MIIVSTRKWTKETITSEINSLNNQGVHVSQTNITKINSTLFHAAKSYFGSWRDAVESSGIDYEEVLSISKIKAKNKLGRQRKRTPNEFVIVGDHKELIVNKRDGTQKIVLVDKNFNFNGKVTVNRQGRAYLNVNHGRDIKQLSRYIMGIDDPNIMVYHINGDILDNRTKNLMLVTRKPDEVKEELLMDELKIYTGKEALQGLLSGKVMKCIDSKIKYKIKNNKLYQEGFTGWSISGLQLIDFLNLEFTEILIPQVGDWVRVDCNNRAYIGQISKLDNNKMYSHWNGKKGDLFFIVDSKDVTWEFLSPKQISEYKREQVFARVGRKLNEFKEDDFVLIDSSIVGVVVSKNNANEIRVHKLNEASKGYTAKPHQLTPIYFAENQVDLS